MCSSQNVYRYDDARSFSTALGASQSNRHVLADVLICITVEIGVRVLRGVENELVAASGKICRWLGCKQQLVDERMVR